MAYLAAWALKQLTSCIGSLSTKRATFGAANNEDYPEVVIYSLPIPGFQREGAAIEEAKRMLIQCTEQLNKLNLGTLGIACNTVHLLAEDIQDTSNAPLVSIMDEVAKVVKIEGYKRIGLLSTLSTYEYGLYDSLASEEAALVEPTDAEKNELAQHIDSVLANTANNKTGFQLEQLAKEFIAREKLDAIVLGCTELPIIFPVIEQVPVISSLDVLADALLENFREDRHEK